MSTTRFESGYPKLKKKKKRKVEFFVE